MLVYELYQTHDVAELFISVKAAKKAADEQKDIRFRTEWRINGRPVTVRERQIVLGPGYLTVQTQRIRNVRVYGGTDTDTGMDDTEG